MSVLFENSSGWVLSHDEYLRSIYKNIFAANSAKQLNFDKYFKLYHPFSRGKDSISKPRTKKRKLNNLSKEAATVKDLYESLKNATDLGNVFNCTVSSDQLDSKEDYRLLSHKFFESIQRQGSLNGGNMNDYSLLSNINDEFYIFPPKCLFFNEDISEISKHLGSRKFDFILLDPPWYNRFVKRRAHYHPDHGYDFLDQKQLCEIPIKTLLKPCGLIGVWTTNSGTHINTVKNLLFPTWGIIETSTWYWIKVTNSGELVVPFSNEDNKQPYERIIFGKGRSRTSENPEDMKCIISVPSSIHSHKPPITELINKYLPKDSSCLELFSRYLLPNWTSYGNQVLSLQLLSLFS